MPNKLFKKAVKQILKEETQPHIELGELPFHLALYPKDGELIVEVRKRWKIRLNEPVTPTVIYIKKMLTAVFSGKPVTAQIKIECSDEFQIKAKCKQYKIL